MAKYIGFKLYLLAAFAFSTSMGLDWYCVGASVENIPVRTRENHFRPLRIRTYQKLKCAVLFLTGGPMQFMKGILNVKINIVIPLYLMTYPSRIFYWDSCWMVHFDGSRLILLRCLWGKRSGKGYVKPFQTLWSHRLWYVVLFPTGGPTLCEENIGRYWYR